MERSNDLSRVIKLAANGRARTRMKVLGLQVTTESAILVEETRSSVFENGPWVRLI